MPDINSITVNGTVYDVKDSSVVDASTSTKGIVQLASEEEVLTGTRNDRAVTPLQVKTIISTKEGEEVGYCNYAEGVTIGVGRTGTVFTVPKDGFVQFQSSTFPTSNGWVRLTIDGKSVIDTSGMPGASGLNSQEFRVKEGSLITISVDSSNYTQYSAYFFPRLN